MSRADGLVGENAIRGAARAPIPICSRREYTVGMTPRSVLAAFFAFAGAFGAPTSAQFIHMSFDIGVEDAGILFHTSSAASPWDHEFGFVTKLDLYYDAEAPLVGMRPGKNWWQMKVDVPFQDHEFLITRSVDSILRSENSLLFISERFGPGVFEDFELLLIFDSVIPTEGLLPIPPLPALGEWEFAEPNFSVFAGRTYFPVADVVEGYGGGRIYGYTAEIMPVPEPSTYAIGALVLTGAAIAVRRRRCVAMGGK